MDCLRVQQLLSEAYDGEQVDAAEYAEARRHTASCRECATFYRALHALAQGPTAPPSLAARVMDLVEVDAAAKHAEAVAKAVAAGGLDPAEAAAPAGTAESGPPLQAETPAGDPGATPSRLMRGRWRVGAGIAAAAAMVLGFGLLTNYGIGLMGGRGTAESASPVAASDESAKLSGEAAPPAAESQADAYDGAARASSAPPMVALSGRVYRLSGSREVTSAPTTPIGTVSTAFDGAGARSVSAYADPTRSASILLRDPDGVWQAFALVTRSRDGRQYALTTGADIPAFGEWPRLPDRYPEPTSPSGSPIFSEGGADDAGVPIHTPRGRDPEDGFAVAPGTPVTDPAAGNPYWTWWEPVEP